MKSVSFSPPLKALAFAVSGLILALPLLGLNCELACARVAARASKKAGPASAQHCPAHDGAVPTGSSSAPTAPDSCGHHGDSAALKKGIEAADQGSRLSTVTAATPACASYAFDRSSALVDSAAQSITPRPPAGLPRVLRL